MSYPQLFSPEVGKTYTNNGGGTFRCLKSFGADAAFINEKSGWKFQAHGCRLYDNGTIEWDYSTGGYFEEEDSYYGTLR